MSSSSFRKKIFILGFLLVILAGLFIWQAQGFGGEYLAWVRSSIAKINPLKIALEDPELTLSQDFVLDLSNVSKVEEIAPDKPIVLDKPVVLDEPEEVNGIGGPIPVVEKVVKMSLEDIEEEINRITEEVKRIDQEVQKLVASEING